MARSISSATARMDNQAAREMMRISVHGNKIPECRVTLLEVLITLVIAGLLISLASLAISRNPRTELVETGEQLALLFESATDEAHIRARQIAWQPVRGGYRFSILENGGWKPLRDALYAPRNWPAPVDRVFI